MNPVKVAMHGYKSAYQFFHTGERRQGPKFGRVHPLMTHEHGVMRSHPHATPPNHIDPAVFEMEAPEPLDSAISPRCAHVITRSNVTQPSRLGHAVGSVLALFAPHEDPGPFTPAPITRPGFEDLVLPIVMFFVPLQCSLETG